MQYETLLQQCSGQEKKTKSSKAYTMLDHDLAIYTIVWDWKIKLERAFFFLWMAIQETQYSHPYNK